MLDIVLAIALAIFTLATAYLGVHVTIHPAETDKGKLAYKLAFGVCGLVACVLIGVQSYRNVMAQRALTAQMSRIEGNTKEPPKVQVNVPPAQIVMPPPAHTKNAAPLIQTSKGDCSPNVNGNGNTNDCNVPPKINASPQSQMQTGNPDFPWRTRFSIQSTALTQLGDLRVN
jgi:hypothetical protein